MSPACSASSLAGVPPASSGSCTSERHHSASPQGDPPHAVRVHAKGAGNRRPPESELELELDERHDLELVLAHHVVGVRERSTGDLAQRHEVLERNAGALAQLGKGDIRKSGEHAEARLVHEREGQLALSNQRANGIDGQARPLERPHDVHAADIRIGVAVAAIEDAELRQAFDLRVAHARSARRDIRPVGRFRHATRLAWR